MIKLSELLSSFRHSHWSQTEVFFRKPYGWIYILCRLHRFNNVLFVYLLKQTQLTLKQFTFIFLLRVRFRWMAIKSSNTGSLTFRGGGIFTYSLLRRVWLKFNPFILFLSARWRYFVKYPPLSMGFWFILQFIVFRLQVWEKIDYLKKNHYKKLKWPRPRFSLNM